jgi:hypothetical protein
MPTHALGYEKAGLKEGDDQLEVQAQVSQIPP